MTANHRIAELAAVIEKALAAYEWAVDAGEALEYMLRALKAVPSGVLAERDAEKWDEGLDAGRDRWMDSREFGDPPVNPYRTRKETD